MKQTMYVDVLWILISDRGSTPRTSTISLFNLISLYATMQTLTPFQVTMLGIGKKLTYDWYMFRGASQ